MSRRAAAVCNNWWACPLLDWLGLPFAGREVAFPLLA